MIQAVLLNVLEQTIFSSSSEIVVGAAYYHHFNAATANTFGMALVEGWATGVHGREIPFKIRFNVSDVKTSQATRQEKKHRK